MRVTERARRARVERVAARPATRSAGVPRGRAFAALASVVMVTHLLVSAFILLGALLVWQGAVAWWVHVPFAAWGVMIHAGNITCPLTPLEKRLRSLAGEQPYEHGFVARYLAPRGLRGRALDWTVVAALVTFNAAVYGLLIR